MRFKAYRVGVLVYHVAREGMVPWHVVSSMSGTLMVLPREGLKDPEGKPLHYDKAYTIGEFDLYIPKDENGKYKDYKTLADSYTDTVEVMRTLTPTHVVFNGKVGALTGRSEEHTSELQSLMRISYAVFCLKKKKQEKSQTTTKNNNTKNNIRTEDA